MAAEVSRSLMNANTLHAHRAAAAPGELFVDGADWPRCPQCGAARRTDRHSATCRACGSRVEGNPSIDAPARETFKEPSRKQAHASDVLLQLRRLPQPSWRCPSCLGGGAVGNEAGHVTAAVPSVATRRGLAQDVDRHRGRSHPRGGRGRCSQSGRLFAQLGVRVFGGFGYHSVGCRALIRRTTDSCRLSPTERAW